LRCVKGRREVLYSNQTNYVKKGKGVEEEASYGKKTTSHLSLKKEGGALTIFRGQTCGVERKRGKRGPLIRGKRRRDRVFQFARREASRGRHRKKVIWRLKSQRQPKKKRRFAARGREGGL